jgi:hypothetical protein
MTGIAGSRAVQVFANEEEATEILEASSTTPPIATRATT